MFITDDAYKDWDFCDIGITLRTDPWSVLAGRVGFAVTMGTYFREQIIVPPITTYSFSAPASLREIVFPQWTISLVAATFPASIYRVYVKDLFFQ
jgi:hypothetical protein